MKNYLEKMPLEVIDMEDYDVILGKPWLTKLNPKINWKSNVI